MRPVLCLLSFGRSGIARGGGGDGQHFAIDSPKNDRAVDMRYGAYLIAIPFTHLADIVVIRQPKFEIQIGQQGVFGLIYHDGAVRAGKPSGDDGPGGGVVGCDRNDTGIFAFGAQQAIEVIGR